MNVVTLDSFLAAYGPEVSDLTVLAREPSTEDDAARLGQHSTPTVLVFQRSGACGSHYVDWWIMPEPSPGFDSPLTLGNVVKSVVHIRIEAVLLFSDRSQMLPCPAIPPGRGQGSSH